MKSKLSFRLLSLVLCLALVVSVFAVVSFSADSQALLITTDAVRLRSTPGFSDNNIITTLSEAETLTLLENSSDSWAKVKRSDGTTGYCSVNYLSPAENSTVSFTGITTEEVNFRKGPSTDYDIIKYLEVGTDFTVTDNTEELWVKAQIGDSEGYVYRLYTELTLALQQQAETEPSEAEPVPSSTAAEPAEPETQAATSPVGEAPADVNTPNWYSSSLLEINSVTSRVSMSGDFVLDADSVDLETGNTYNLSVLSLGSGFENSVTFTSSDPSVAVVYKGGIVTGVSEGTATVTASFNGKKASCEVKVTGEPYIPTTPTEPDTEPSSQPETQPVATTPATTVPETNPYDFQLSASAATVEKGNLYVLTSPMENTLWSSSDTKVATVKDGLVTALAEGKAEIIATADGKKASCKLTVTKTGTGLTIEYSEIEVTKGKTFYNGAASSAEVNWTTSDKSVAEVSNGFITARGEGTAVVTATSSKGTKTCLVTVTEAEPVRFAYAYPNTAYKGEKISLVAITDTTRTAVQFKIDVNGTVKTVDATSKKADGNTLVWTGTTELSQSGTFKVTAYSKLGAKYSSCADSKTTVFIRETEDLIKESQETRRVSDELIALLASFEGYVGNVYFDNLAGGIPTLGYGKVVYIGDTFYNDMTKTEAYAMLCDTVNNGGYSSNVNSYLQSLDANYNQQQFDALVSFAYNIGYYGLKSDSEIRALILGSVEKPDTEEKSENAAYVNGTQVNLRSGAGTEFDSLGWLSYPDTLTLVETELVNKSWYHVKTADGREGYIYKDYVTMGVPVVEGDIYLSLIDKAEFTRVILEYHHASSQCIWGLLQRRVDELDLFYYGDYVRDGYSNRFGYSFVCNRDKSFKL